MGSLGLPELIIIFFIIVVIFGASRLPGLGRGIGSAIRNFQAVQHADRSITLKVVPGAAYDPSATRAIEALVSRYLPGTGFSLETVVELPPSASGKRQVVVVEH